MTSSSPTTSPSSTTALSAPSPAASSTSKPRRLRIEADPIEILGRRLPDLIAAAKQPIVQFLNVNASDFGLITNATEGVNTVLRSLSLQPGDELLTTTHVYNAVRRSMRHIALIAGATYREIDIPLPLTLRHRHRIRDR